MAAITKLIGGRSSTDARQLLSWHVGNKSGPRGRGGLKEKMASESLVTLSIEQFHFLPGRRDLHFPLAQVVSLARGGSVGFGRGGRRESRSQMWLLPSPLLGAPNHSK